MTFTPRKHPVPPPHVVIIGGGLAGLAAASSFVDRGLKITLLESRPRLGGRASSFNDPVTGELIDNCQHVSMACCTNLAHFCQKVGLQSLFIRDPQVVFLSPEGRVSRLRAGLLPAPFHLAGSFLRARYLSWTDKLRVAYALACLPSNRRDRPGESFGAWLKRHHQSPSSINRYWAPVLISALNEQLDQMDVPHARKVFLDGFMRNRTGYQMEIPLVPLGELYGTRLEEWLTRQGVSLRLSTGVRSIDFDLDGSASGVTLRSGEIIPADFVLSTIPFDRLPALIPPHISNRLPALQSLTSLQASPITGIHLWFDRPVCPYDHVVTIGRQIQWVFNHTAIQGRSPGDASHGQYLQLVISASYSLLPLDKTQILALVLDELSQIWPAAREAQLLRSWVVTEHGATFAVRPGVDAHRPPQRTPIEALFLAGDWTSTSWPATMEGAVRSGYLAAEQILQDLGRPTPLLQPPLPSSFLARLLLGPPSELTAPPPASPTSHLPIPTAADSQIK